MNNKYQISSWLNKNYIIHFEDTGTYEYVCKLCSESLFLQETGLEHFYKEHKEWFEFIWLSYERKEKEKEKEKDEEKGQIRVDEKVKKPKYRVHIKPWKNPDSLFCDKEFLEKLTGKKLLDGGECGDKI